MTALDNLRAAIRTDFMFWRKALHAGVQYGPDPWVRYSPPLFGAAFAAALPEPRRVVRDTLRRALGRRPAADEMRDVVSVFANFASSMTEAMLVGADRGYHVTSRPVGAWNFMAAHAAGRGVIFASAQTAGWDIASSTIPCDSEVWVVMEPEPSEAARELHDQFRQTPGIRLVHVGDDPLASLPILRHLRGGGVVALKFDRRAWGMRARQVTLFGEPWTIPEGPLSLAALSGAAIVPAFSRRIGFLQYEHYIRPPISLPRRPSDRELDAAAQHLVSELEIFVRRFPTQWIRFREQSTP